MEYEYASYAVACFKVDDGDFRAKGGSPMYWLEEYIDEVLNTVKNPDSFLYECFRGFLRRGNKTLTILKIEFYGNAGNEQEFKKEIWRFVKKFSKRHPLQRVTFYVQGGYEAI